MVLVCIAVLAVTDLSRPSSDTNDVRREAANLRVNENSIPLSDIEPVEWETVIEGMTKKIDKNADGVISFSEARRSSDEIVKQMNMSNSSQMKQSALNIFAGNYFQSTEIIPRICSEAGTSQVNLISAMKVINRAELVKAISHDPEFNTVFENESFLKVQNKLSLPVITAELNAIAEEGGETLHGLCKRLNKLSVSELKAMFHFSVVNPDAHRILMN